MRSILIVGAGLSGMQLALGLQAAGCAVTVISERSAAAIRHGPLLAGQCRFGTGLALERERGLDFWSARCPRIDGLALAVPYPADPGAKMLDWSQRFDRAAQSVDPRLKIPRWMDEFQQRGGVLRVHAATPADLDRWSAEHDLVIVATDEGPLAGLFDADTARSPQHGAQRVVAIACVTGMRARRGHTALNLNLVPGVGAYVSFPALSTSGPCDVMVFEAVPGGAMDGWSRVQTPQQHLLHALRVLDAFVPWESPRCAHLQLADANATRIATVRTAVHHPYARLPSGRLVLGMGDMLVRDDAFTGQGANNAARCARAVEQAILAHGAEPFDAGFMQRTFDRRWQHARHVLGWARAMRGALPPHILRVLAAAGEFPEVARRVVNGFDDPCDVADFLLTPEKVDSFLGRVVCLP